MAVRLLVLNVMLFVSIGSYARENLWDSDFDFDKGKIVNGVFTVTDASTGTVMTVTNASYVHYYNASIGDWYNCFLRFKNKGNVTITFKFPNSHLTYRGIDGETNTGLTKWGSGSGNTKALNNATFTPVAGQENTYSFTFSGCDNMKIEQVFLNWCLGPDDFVGPEGVTKTYTGWSQTLYKYNSTPNVCPYGQWGGALCNLKFKETTSATDKGSYTLHWYVEEYSGFTNYSKSKSGLDWMYGLGFGSADNPVGTITSEIIGYQMTDVVAPTAKELVYTGEPQALVTAATSSRGTAMYWIPGDAGYSDAIPEKTDAGTYKVYWYLKSTQKAYNDYGGAGEDTRKGPITVTISKVNIPAYTAPTPLTKVFNGVEQPLVSAGSATGGTLRYRLGTDGEWLEEVPKAMPMGDYEIYWYVVGDNNHYDMGSESEPYGSFTAHITPAEYNMNTLKWQGASTVIYDGLDHQSELTLIESSLPAGVAITSYTLKDGSNADATEAVNAGTYTLTAHLTSTNPNYAAPAPVSTTLTIQPFNLQNAYVASTIADQTYTAEAITPASPALKVKIDGIEIPTSAYNITYLNNINAGVKTASATLYANGNNGNYTGSTAVKFTILRKSIQVSTVDQVITYGDALNSSVEKAGLIGAITGHTISSVTLTADHTLGIGDHVNAIVASDVHIKDGSDNDVTDNYAITYPENNRGKLTITAKAGTGFTISGLNAEYEGDGVTAVAPDGDIAVYDGATKLIKGTDYTVEYTNNILAGTATATFAFQGNYSGTTTKNFTIYYVAETFSRSATPAYNYCTYYHPSEKLKAVGGEVFFCTLNDTKTDVVLTPVTSNVINVGVPVMLRTSSTSKAVKLYATTEADASYTGTNALTGVGSSETYSVGKTVTSSDKIFIFDGESFVWATSGHLVKHKAFINGSGFSFSRIYIVYGDDETTGLIPTEDVGDNMEDVWYDLMGNRINKPTRKGLYIKNGKKVLVKTSGRAER